MKEVCGSIYILTNPSFKEWVKIGYSKNVQERLNKLNDSEAVPFAFRLFATYDVEVQSADKILHNIIDKLNSNLRSIDNIGDKRRVREFYLLSPDDAYQLLYDIAMISGTLDRLNLCTPTDEEIKEESMADEVKVLAKNRHHFKDIEFTSSLTNKKYYSRTKEDGTLGIYESDTNIEVPSNSTPSKKQILFYALKDLGEDIDLKYFTLYQLQHKLEKILLDKE